MPGGVMIIMLIIMAMTTDTIKEPDTKSAGMLQMLLKAVVFIFFDPVENCAIKKTLCG